MTPTDETLRKLGLRNEVRILIESGFKGMQQDSGKPLNQEIWLDMITDKVIAAFKGFLPEPVDIKAKYEVEPNTGVHIVLSDKRTEQDFKSDAQQLDFLANYADDEGYNRYHREVSGNIAKLYETE